MPNKTKEALQKRNRKYYQDNKETIKARVRKYSQENKEAIAEYRKRHRQENKEQYKSKGAKHYQKNRKRIRKRNNEYTAIHGEENRARVAKWYQENPERARENAKVANHKRRARIAEVGGNFTKADIRKLYRAQWMRCYYCSISIEEEYHIDHMTPIIRKGSNWVANLCLTCPGCNLSKHTQTAEEFIEQKGFMYGI